MAGEGRGGEGGGDCSKVIQGDLKTMSIQVEGVKSCWDYIILANTYCKHAFLRLRVTSNFTDLSIYQAIK